MPANLYSIDSRMIRHPNCRVSSEPYPERGCTAKDSRIDNKHSTHPLNLRQAVQINARTVRRPRVRPKSPGKPRRAQHLERTRPLPHSADGLTTHTYAEARPARHTISQASQFGYEYTPTHANQSLQPRGRSHSAAAIVNGTPESGSCSTRLASGVRQSGRGPRSSRRYHRDRNNRNMGRSPGCDQAAMAAAHASGIDPRATNAGTRWAIRKHALSWSQIVGDWFRRAPDHATSSPPSDHIRLVPAAPSGS